MFSTTFVIPMTVRDILIVGINVIVGIVKQRKNSRVCVHTKLTELSDAIGIPTIILIYTISIFLTLIGIIKVVNRKCVYLIHSVEYHIYVR